jgi:hypothetical protein
MSAAVAAKISDAMLTSATIAEVRPAISQQRLNPNLLSIAKAAPVPGQCKSHAVMPIEGAGPTRSSANGME